jgi:hypothetical protein
MPKLLIPSPNGGRTEVSIPHGPVLPHLRRLKAQPAAARFGLFRKQGSEWLKVPLTSVSRPGQVYMVGFPQQKATGDGFAGILKRIFSSARRRTR